MSGKMHYAILRKLSAVGYRATRFKIERLKSSIDATYSPAAPSLVKLGSLTTEFFVESKPDGGVVIQHNDAAQDPIVLTQTTFDALVDVCKEPTTVSKALARLEACRTLRACARPDYCCPLCFCGLACQANRRS